MYGQKEEKMKSHTLLYAEDDELVRENLLYLLRDYFDEIFVVNDGQEALQTYYDKRPDIVILDISMPQIDGLEVARKIREKDENLPIIMLTGHSDRERLLDAVNLKLEAYLVKPVDYTKLNDILDKTIEKISETSIIPFRKELIWDAQTQILRYKNRALKLTKKEKLTIEVLAQNLNKYVSNDALIYHVWDDEIPDESHDNKLIQLIYRLNKKIYEQTDYNEKLVENSYTLGYRILHIDE